MSFLGQYTRIIMEFSKNYGQIIIGYGLLSIGITLLMLFLQTTGIFWLILSAGSIVTGVWIIKKERNDREKQDSDDECAFQDNKPD